MDEEGGRGRRGWGRERGAGGSCRREEGRNLQRHPGIDAGEMPPKRPRGAPNRRRSPKKDTQRAGRADHRAYRAYHRAYRAYQRRAYERCCNPYRDGHRAYQAYRAYQPRTLTEHTASIPRAYREHTASIPPPSISISRALTFRAAFAVACRANHSSARRRYGCTHIHNGVRNSLLGPVRENRRPPLPLL